MYADGDIDSQVRIPPSIWLVTNNYTTLRQLGIFHDVQRKAAILCHGQSFSVSQLLVVT